VRARPGLARRVSVVAAGVVALGAVFTVPAAASASSAAVTTCATLASGSVGPAVSTIQAVIGTTTDGDFGSATQKALKKWQKAAGIATTGVVDAATWSALPTATGEKACGQPVSGAGVTTTCATLASGTSGLTVAVLQKAASLMVDGSYGGATIAVVKQVQQGAKLKPTGVTDVKTWKALKLLGTPACSTTGSIKGPTGTPGPTGPSDLKAQAKIRAKVATLAAKLVKKPGTSGNQVALQAMAFARKQIGKPYVWGGTGPTGYDCSGLTMTAYQHAGLTIPRVAAAQYAGAGVQVPLNDAKQGDLLFYAADLAKPSTVYHVVMYVGGGRVLQAPHTGADVSTAPLSTAGLLPIAIRPVGGLSLPIKPGASGWSVTQLQQDLNRHGAALAVDGGYGASTQAAVKAWQHSHKLKADAVVRTPTWLTLG
jgi:peptidoglycan DL-endopeptidase CwlO